MSPNLKSCIVNRTQKNWQTQAFKYKPYIHKHQNYEALRFGKEIFPHLMIRPWWTYYKLIYLADLNILSWLQNPKNLEIYMRNKGCFQIHDDFILHKHKQRCIHCLSTISRMLILVLKVQDIQQGVICSVASNWIWDVYILTL